MTKETVQLRINLWLENDKGSLFGMGRFILLEQISKCGSLKQAAEALGMSYRAAWGKMKQTEELLGASLIEKHGSNRSGYRLTSLGHELMASYEAWFKDVEDYAVAKANEKLNWKVMAYQKKL